MNICEILVYHGLPNTGSFHFIPAFAFSPYPVGRFIQSSVATNVKTAHQSAKSGLDLFARPRSQLCDATAPKGQQR